MAKKNLTELEKAMRFSAKTLQSASTGIAANINAEAKALRAERKTLKATIAFIAESDSEEAEAFRAFLNLPKNANKKRRAEVCVWCEARAPFVKRRVFVDTPIDGEADEVNVEFGNVVPVSKSGRIIADQLTTIAIIRKLYEANMAKRAEIARQMASTRRKLWAMGHDVYMAHLDNVRSYVNRAPAKLQPQINLGEIIIRK